MTSTNKLKSEERLGKVWFISHELLSRTTSGIWKSRYTAALFMKQCLVKNKLCQKPQSRNLSIKHKYSYAHIFDYDSKRYISISNIIIIIGIINLRLRIAIGMNSIWSLAGDRPWWKAVWCLIWGWGYPGGCIHSKHVHPCCWSWNSITSSIGKPV